MRTNNNNNNNKTTTLVLVLVSHPKCTCHLPVAFPEVHEQYENEKASQVYSCSSTAYKRKRKKEKNEDWTGSEIVKLLSNYCTAELTFVKANLGYCY